MVVLACRLAGRHGDGRLLVGEELLGRLVHADQRLIEIGRSGVNVEDFFHLGDEPSRATLGDTAGLFTPRLQLVFLSV